MAKLKIDGFDLAFALDSDGDQTTNFLNLDTGEIVTVFDGEVNGEEVDDVDEYLDSGNFRRIEPMDSRESFSVMDDFVSSLPAGTPRSTLREALSGNRPFRRFKDAIYNFPALKDPWFDFEEMRKRQYLEELVAGFGVDAEINWPVRPAPTPPPVAKSGPSERVVTEFTWFSHKSELERCRLTVRKTKKETTIHVDHYNGDILVHEGLSISPEDIDPLIEALRRVQAEC